MTTVAFQLAEPLQMLIDARLDTIDRMLLGRVPRADRLAIVREVEAQILEQLGEHDADRIGRDDVLGVLGRLDPPEAYLPDEFGAEEAPPRPAPAARPGPAGAPRRRASRLASASAIVGLGAGVAGLAVPMLATLIAISLENELLLLMGWFGTLVLVLTGVITAIVLAIRAGLDNGRAILGLVSGVIAPLLLAAGIVLHFVLAQFLAGV